MPQKKEFFYTMMSCCQLHFYGQRGYKLSFIGLKWKRSVLQPEITPLIHRTDVNIGL